jgi:hypothetical protein
MILWPFTPNSATKSNFLFSQSGLWYYTSPLKVSHGLLIQTKTDICFNNTVFILSLPCLTTHNSLRRCCLIFLHFKQVKEKLLLCVITHCDMKIYNLIIRWKWVVSFKPQLLYIQENKPLYPLAKRMGGPQSWSGYCGEKSLTSARNQTPIPQLSNL